MEYPWYDVVDSNEPLLQGDFISSCPVFVPTTTIKVGTIPAEVKEYDVVVMSQSCDLIEKKIDIVLVCPVWSLSEVGQQNAYLNGYEGKEELRRGHILGYHLLDKCTLENFKSDFKVVDYRSVFGMDINHIFTLAKNVEKRLRLLPPYREHLSQAFARFFMRVGLPVDIAPFVKNRK